MGRLPRPSAPVNLCPAVERHQYYNQLDDALGTPVKITLWATGPFRAAEGAGYHAPTVAQRDSINLAASSAVWASTSVSRWPSAQSGDPLPSSLAATLTSLEVDRASKGARC